MKIIAIPIEHLVLDGIKKLDRFILMPVAFVLMDDYTLDNCLKEDELIIIDYIINNQRPLLEEMMKLEDCTLAFTKCEDDSDLDIDSISYELERAFDYIIITQYRYDRREWSVGIPGTILNNKIGILMDTSNDNNKIILKEKHMFCEIPGMGLEISFNSLSEMDEELYNILFSKREDEVYKVCRGYITKACRTFYIDDLNDVFIQLFNIIEGIGMVGHQSFLRFTLENERIMALLSKNQDEYEQRLDLYCYYSETLRTMILHYGKDILQLMDMKSAFRMLTDVFYTIISYATELIKLEVMDLDQLDEAIQQHVNGFEKHSPAVNTFTMKYERIDCEGERDILIFPLDNFSVNEFIAFKNICIIPPNFLISDDIKEREIFIDDIKKIMAYEDIKNMNEKTALILYKGEYYFDDIDTSERTWQYIDDICGKIQDELVFIYINSCSLENRDYFFSPVGIFDGIRMGKLYDISYDKMYSLAGRVYSLFNKTPNSFIFEKNKIEAWIYKAVLENNRNDIVAIDCKVAIQNIGKALYADNFTYSFMHLFDAIEQTYPISHNIGEKWKWIAGFIMNGRNGYDRVHKRLKQIGDDYRKPIYHYGKNAEEIFGKEDDMHIVLLELKEIVLKYCKEVLETGCTTYDELKNERSNRMKAR